MTPHTIALMLESDGPGGAELVLLRLAEALRTRGHAVVPFVPADRVGWLGAKLRESGFEPEEFRERPPPDFALLVDLARRLRRRGVDLVHSHEFTMAVYGAWAARRARIPHVVTMHGSRYYASRWRRRLALRAAIALSARTVAVSLPLAEHIRRDLRVPPSAITTIANGVRYVPPDRVTLREELQLGPEDRLALAVGNLYPVKGHRNLVDALSLLRERHPRLHVAIGGRGELAEALAGQAKDLGVADRLHLLGLRSDVPAILAAADVFVLPSLSEGLPLALLEAMFAGRPIVASNVGEVGTALAHGQAGILVEAGQAPALAAGLDRLLTSPAWARALGERAARRAADEYDVSHMVRRYVGAYQAAGT